MLPERKERFVAIDIWRGFSMVLVIMAHLLVGLYSEEITYEKAMADPILLIISVLSSVGPLFFFLSGAAIIIAMERMAKSGRSPRAILSKEIKRGLFLILLGVLYDPVVYFHFGIVDTLHQIGLGNIILALACYGLVKRRVAQVRGDDIKAMDADREKQGKRFVVAGFSIVILGVLFRLATNWYPVYDPAVENLIIYVPPATTFEMFQGWITTSFFPVFPYTAYFFFGAWYALRLLRARNELAKRKLARFMIIAGIIALAFAVVYELTGESITGDLAWQPYNLQPYWVIEMLLNIQPLTTGAFFLYLSISLIGIGLLSIIFEVKHSEKVANRIGTMYNKLGFGLIFNTLARFSYNSLTIYMIQYAWIPVLRVITIATGIPLMYSINDLLLIYGIIAVAEILFAVYVKLMESHPKMQRFTFEQILKRIK